MAMRLFSADLPGETIYSIQQLDPTTLSNNDRHRIVHIIDADLQLLDFVVAERRNTEGPDMTSVKIRILLTSIKPGIHLDAIYSTYERIRRLGALLANGFADVTLQICNSEEYRPFPRNLAFAKYLRYMGRFYVLSRSTMVTELGPMENTIRIVFEIHRLLSYLQKGEIEETRELAELLFVGEKKLAMAVVRDEEAKGPECILKESDIKAFEETLERKNLETERRDLEAEQHKAGKTEGDEGGIEAKKDGKKGAALEQPK